MRLLGTLIVALLAFTMAIFPISVAPVAASGGHQHALSADAERGHAHEHADNGDHEHGDVLTSPGNTVTADVSDHDGSSRDCTGPACCSMGTCHAFQDTDLPVLYSPGASRLPIAMPGDEQVGGITAGGLDRPPRTV
ncbi:hypothetical protein KBI52_17030 [Microvirga sp. HBU67558]|uniref:hypothetical protein n=1 Tax=Microvirga TaxID=186650 RepID=UPI001B3717DB|nr:MULTISPECIES: hypothetical protein [unclassified Microvirga]MBQ0821898.1 hypothetical protein [Microvirga sp. HBU67558]